MIFFPTFCLLALVFCFCSYRPEVTANKLNKHRRDESVDHELQERKEEDEILPSISDSFFPKPFNIPEILKIFILSFWVKYRQTNAFFGISAIDL